MFALLATVSFAVASDNAARDGAVVALGTTAMTYVGAAGGGLLGAGAGFLFCPNDCGFDSGGEDYAAPWAGGILGGLAGANIGAAAGAAGFARITQHRQAVPAIVAGTTFAAWTTLSIGVGAFTKDLLGTAVPTEEILALGGMAILPGVAAGIAVGFSTPEQRLVLVPAPTRGFGPGWALTGMF